MWIKKRKKADHSGSIGHCHSSPLSLPPTILTTTLTNMSTLTKLCRLSQIHILRHNAQPSTTIPGPFPISRLFSSSSSSSTKPTTKLSEEEESKIRMLRTEGKAPASGRLLSDIANEIWLCNTNTTNTSSETTTRHRSGAKLLRKPLKGPLYTSWYPKTLGEFEGNEFKLTDKQRRWKQKLKFLRASGKGPPKKGSGKRSK